MYLTCSGVDTGPLRDVPCCSGCCTRILRALVAVRWASMGQTCSSTSHRCLIGLGSVEFEGKVDARLSLCTSFLRSSISLGFSSLVHQLVTWMSCSGSMNCKSVCCTHLCEGRWLNYPAVCCQSLSSQVAMV